MPDNKPSFILHTRQLVPEVMDDPALGSAAHHVALAGLTRINAISFVGAKVFSAIRTISSANELQIVDVASGGGDVTLALYKQSRKLGLNWQISGCDISLTALKHATEAARRQNADVRFTQRDVLGQPLPPADVYVSSLFFHHLTQPQALYLLTSMATTARKGLVVSDLTRSRVALLATQIGVQLLSRSPVVHVDGPRSVRAAFTPAEFDALCRQAGLSSHRIRKVWPMRMLLSWSRQ